MSCAARPGGDSDRAASRQPDEERDGGALEPVHQLLGHGDDLVEPLHLGVVLLAPLGVRLGHAGRRLGGAGHADALGVHGADRVRLEPAEGGVTTSAPTSPSMPPRPAK